METGDSRSPNLSISQSPVSSLQSPTTYLESLRAALHAILERDPTAVVLGEDILDPYGGAFKVTQGLSTRFPDRVFTTPICEASIVGMSVGMALARAAPHRRDHVWRLRGAGRRPDRQPRGQVPGHVQRAGTRAAGDAYAHGRRPRLRPDAQPVARTALFRHPAPQAGGGVARPRCRRALAAGRGRPGAGHLRRKQAALSAAAGAWQATSSRGRRRPTATATRS